MPQDRFMIAPLQGGLDTSLKPWQITDDSFSRLNNAYIFRGRVRKRFGSRLMNGGVAQNIAQLFSRLRISMGPLVAGTLTAIVPGTKRNIGQLFSVGPDIFTVWQNGAMKSTNVAANGTFNTATGQFTINDPTFPAGVVYWYPADPVMALLQYQTADNLNDPTYAFDTQFAYQYNEAGSGAWSRLGTAIWTGSDSQFFWGTTWQGVSPSTRNLFVVNNNAADQIKYWNLATNVWTTINPRIDAVVGDTLETALIVISFKNRLIFLNTTEIVGGLTQKFTNRARYGAFGDPTTATAFRSDIPGQGNAIDASTMEDIVSCTFIKDRLIVFFERSTWELAFTGNQAQPFTWQQINTELGAESTWSVVPFDQVCLAIANVGIHACNGQNVERIDTKIPDTVWNIHTGTASTRRVYGIRDYYAEQVYWTFPDVDENPANQKFPDQVLVYNYKTGSWAMNDDSITVFGYYFAANVSAITWDSTDITWDNDEITWDSGAGQPLNELILAGNQEGFVFIVDANDTDNAPALQITNITAPANVVTLKVINHNLSVNNGNDQSDFIYIQFLNGLTGPFPLIYSINTIIDADTFTIIAPDILAALLLGQVYTGGGTIARVSRIDIFTKQFNFYVQEDRNAMVQKVNFLVDRTDSGQITIDYATSTANPESNGLIAAAQLNGVLLGTSVLQTSPYTLYPLEQKQDRLWHPVYLQADGECVQLRIYLSDTQMLDFNVATSGFQLHAFTFYAMKTSSRLQ